MMFTRRSYQATLNNRSMSRYSQLYIERGRPSADSKRARIRLHALFSSLLPPDHRGQVAEVLAMELGIEPIGIETFLKECGVRDLLDAITVIFRYMKKYNDDLLYNGPDDYDPYEAWHIAASRIFREENLAYRLDKDGIVHPYIDPEFEANRTSALDALSAPMFGEARTDFDHAFRHLRGREYKQAMRMMFPAVEVAAKVLFPGAFSRLMPNEVDKYLRPKVELRYSGNKPAITAGCQLLDGMKTWIVAAQPYRHGQEQQEPAEPPEDFVIAHLSTGASYLRWMIELCSAQETDPA
jgi:hypothetical protein